MDSNSSVLTSWNFDKRVLTSVAALALAGILAAGCAKSEDKKSTPAAAPAPVAQPVVVTPAADAYGGENIRTDFLANYGDRNYYFPIEEKRFSTAVTEKGIIAGTYDSVKNGAVYLKDQTVAGYNAIKDTLFTRSNVTPVSGGALGADPRAFHLWIDKDGHYVLYNVHKTASLDGDSRQADCVGDEHGQITHVQKLSTGGGSTVQLGKDSISVAGLEGALVLKPTQTILTQTSTIGATDSSSHYTQANYEKICTRQDARVIGIENFTHGAFVVSDKTFQGSAVTQEDPTGFFLHDQLMVIDGSDKWVYLNAPLAKRAFQDLSVSVKNNVSGLQVLGSKVKSLEASSTQSVSADTSISGNVVGLSVGPVNSETFYPVAQFEGNLEDASYNIQSGQISFSLANYNATRNVNQFQDSGANTGFLSALRRSETDVGRSVSTLNERKLKSSTSRLKIGFDTLGRNRVLIDEKAETSSY